MKVKVFKFVANECGSDKFNSFNCNYVEHEINSWADEGNYTIMDIKVNTVEYDYHNNGGTNGIGIIYTVLYK